MCFEFYKLLRREMRISLSSFIGLLTYSTFFFLAILIFVFSVGSNLERLNDFYLPIIWVVSLFSLILISESFVLHDHLDGGLKELQFLGFSEELILMSKALTMWIILMIPNLIFFPICSILFSINLENLIKLILNILIASPTLILISLLSAFFSIQVKRNKLLQFVIAMPFYIPVIIFATSTNKISIMGGMQNNNFFILTGIFFITLPLSLLAGKLIIKETNN